MQKILITGATGFIGTYLCENLLLQGQDFRGLVYGTENTTIDSKYLVQGSLLDREGLKKIMREYQPDAIIHLAAVASVIHQNLSEFYEVNVCGTENLLEAAKATCKPETRVVLTSTAGVYGNQNSEFYHEELPFNPANHYSYSKTVMEFLSRNYTDCLDIVIVRPFNVIGPGQRETFFVPKILRSFAEKQPSISLGNITSVRDYVDVAFCAKVLSQLACMEKIQYPVVNICSGIPSSGEDVLRLLAEITGYMPKIETREEYVRHNEVWRMVGCKKRLDTIVGNKYECPALKDVLTAMLENFYTHNPAK